MEEKRRCRMIFSRSWKKRKLRSGGHLSSLSFQPGSDERGLTPLSFELESNLHILRNIFADCTDVLFHDFWISGSRRAILIYINGTANQEELNQQVLTPLLEGRRRSAGSPLFHGIIPVASGSEIGTIEETVRHVMDGNPVILTDGENTATSVGLTKWETRSVEEPIAESVVRGPREGFVETVEINTSLLRKRLRTPLLKMKSYKLGSISHTEVVIAYLQGVAEKALVDEVEKRLHSIRIDGVLDSGDLEELLQDNPYSPFPQLLSTERPDIACSQLLEGRVVILVEGSPIAVVAPTTFYSFLQSPEDYYERYFFGTVIRWLRYLFLFIALLGPSFYVAIVSFHQEMIPTALLLTMANSRELVPFPALLEALLMEITFEALREAGVRLPKQVGAAVSIVGALVIGQAAIEAGLVSSPMVMVVAITGIASFIIPHYTLGVAIRILRFPIMLLSGIFGIMGLMLGLLMLLTHLFTLRSFGVPYLSPLAPLNLQELSDVMARVPLWMTDASVDEHRGKNTGRDQEPDTT
ncbi:spore germination protein [Brevibacillus borstelensis]|uniref:Spore germination protein KA n=2 Tax=Brevibacillus TaxID=55080 RepID=M8DF28_9BACL|nr:spore germination protein KA [Brevibacillus borstelensis AK1]RNB64713.1 spore germination protein [Brevibacillus borstelensis]